LTQVLPLHFSGGRRALTVNPAIQFVVFLVVLIGLWFVLTRNTRAQQRRVADLQEEIAIGDEVIITAGIFGTVRSVNEDRVELEIAEGTVITVARQVVVRRAPEPDAVPADAVPIDRQDPESEETQDRG
jgi:preprotein translocase subunit YajC